MGGINIKKKHLSLFFITLSIVLVIVFIRWNDYREKELLDVLDAKQIEEVLYNKAPFEYDELHFNRSIRKSDSLDELINFFSQYKVKKTGTRNFSSKYPDEQFAFQLKYIDKRNTIPSLIERDVLLIGNYQYKITDGFIDYKWLEEFLERLE